MKFAPNGTPENKPILNPYQPILGEKMARMRTVKVIGATMLRFVIVRLPLLGLLNQLHQRHHLRLRRHKNTLQLLFAEMLVQKCPNVELLPPAANNTPARQPFLRLAAIPELQVMPQPSAIKLPLIMLCNIIGHAPIIPTPLTSTKKNNLACPRIPLKSLPEYQKRDNRRAQKTGPTISTRSNIFCLKTKIYPACSCCSGFQSRFDGLTTKPLRIALALALTRTTLPSMTARTFCTLGLNFRFVLPVIFRPTPPRYLALPRCVYERPARVDFPVK